MVEILVKGYVRTDRLHLPAPNSLLLLKRKPTNCYTELTAKQLHSDQRTTSSYSIVKPVVFTSSSHGTLPDNSTMSLRLSTCNSSRTVKEISLTDL
jgi:hypothetical protein